MATQHEKTLTGEITHYIQSVAYDDLPADVIQRAKEAVIDGIGVMLAGHPTDCATLIRRYIQGLGVKGSCTVVGDSTPSMAAYAALANGVAGHAHDYDDTQISAAPDRVYGLLTHPTTPVLAAALPVAEETGTGGRDLLTSFCIGVEVACKMAETILTIPYK